MAVPKGRPFKLVLPILKYFTLTNQFCEDKIEEWEITSRNYFVSHYLHPEWPNGFSGITIGIGYDLGYVTPSQFKSDWSALLPPATIALLLTVVGLKSTSAKNALSSVRDAIVGYDESRSVFENVSLPNSERQMLSIYPQATSLPDNCYGMLVGMVYNRGASLVGERRTEMKAIQTCVKKGDVKGIAAQVLSMRRFWPKASGLYARYTESASIVTASIKNN